MISFFISILVTVPDGDGKAQRIVLVDGILCGACTCKMTTKGKGRRWCHYGDTEQLFIIRGLVAYFNSLET